LGLPLAAAEPALTEIQKVYVMPMSGGFDQYLAEQLTREGVFTVVVDPKQATAVLTERADRGFAEALEEVSGPAKKAAPASGPEPLPAYRRPAGRGRGNVFLVGVASHQVLWSTFRDRDDLSPKGLSRTARLVVQDLKRGLKKE
jgi:hypothetical protein